MSRVAAYLAADEAEVTRCQYDVYFTCLLLNSNMYGIFIYWPKI